VCLLTVTDVSVTSDGIGSPSASKSLNNYLACFKRSVRLSHLLSSTL